MVAPPACEPDQDTSVILFSASWPLSSRPAAVFDSAFTSSHGSRLLTLRSLFAHSSAVLFSTPPSFGSFSRALPRPRVLPDPNAHFVPPFSVFPLADPEFLPGRQSRPSVLMHSSNRYPLGNCDSPKPETSLDYLTRLGTVSHRS